MKIGGCGGYFSKGSINMELYGNFFDIEHEASIVVGIE
jgi:hypothetical protein